MTYVDFYSLDDKIFLMRCGPFDASELSAYLFKLHCVICGCFYKLVEA